MLPATSTENHLTVVVDRIISDSAPSRRPDDCSIGDVVVGLLPSRV
jgi:hypothetical protein